MKINDNEFPNVAMWDVVRHTADQLINSGTDPKVINKNCGKFGYNSDFLLGVDGILNKMVDFHQKAREDAQLTNSKFYLNSYLCYYEYDHYLIQDNHNNRTYVVYMIKKNGRL